MKLSPAEQKILTDVDRNGLHVVKVDAQNNTPGWAYSIGIHKTVQQPEVIVFGGGVFGPATRFLERIRDEAVRWAQPIAVRETRFVVSTLGGDAGLYGAGRLALLSHSPSTETGVDAPVVVGGIIPPVDAAKLAEAGIERVYTPKDFDLNRIMGDIAELVAARATASQPA